LAKSTVQAALFHLNTDQRKPVADLVASSSWAEEAFVKPELVSNKPPESWLVLQALLKFTQALLVAAARERDVRVVGLAVKHKTAGLSGGFDELLQQEQGRCESNPGEEYTCSFKEAGYLKLNGNVWMMQFPQARGYATELAVCAVTEKNQRNMPRFRCGPAEVISRRTKTTTKRRQLMDNFRRQRDGHKKAHKSTAGSLHSQGLKQGVEVFETAVFDDNFAAAIVVFDRDLET
jgi:hypothetical protein